MVSKAEALAWVRLEESKVEGQVGQVQAGSPFLEVAGVGPHQMVLAVPLDVALLVFLDLG